VPVLTARLLVPICSSSVAVLLILARSTPRSTCRVPVWGVWSVTLTLQRMLQGWEVALNRDKARISRELDVAVQQFAAGLITQQQVQEAFRWAPACSMLQLPGLLLLLRGCSCRCQACSNLFELSVAVADVHCTYATG
jgi:hypothetical protein